MGREREKPGVAAGSSIAKLARRNKEKPRGSWWNGDSSSKLFLVRGWL